MLAQPSQTSPVDSRVSREARLPNWNTAGAPRWVQKYLWRNATRRLCVASRYMCSGKFVAVAFPFHTTLLRPR
jgi:hypothetical protein